MRINYSDEESFDGQFNLWQANCRRSLKGKVGQKALRELEAALLALPRPRLIANELQDESGDVCAIGALVKAKGITPTHDPEYEMDDIGVECGMPRLVAWKVVELNDVLLDTVWEQVLGPLHRHEAHYDGRILLVRDMTPEERYDKVLAWVRQQLVEKSA